MSDDEGVMARLERDGHCGSDNCPDCNRTMPPMTSTPSPGKLGSPDRFAKWADELSTSTEPMDTHDRVALREMAKILRARATPDGEGRAAIKDARDHLAHFAARCFHPKGVSLSAIEAQKLSASIKSVLASKADACP